MESRWYIAGSVNEREMNETRCCALREHTR